MNIKNILNKKLIFKYYLVFKNLNNGKRTRKGRPEYLRRTKSSISGTTSVSD